MDKVCEDVFFYTLLNWFVKGVSKTYVNTNQ